MESSPPPRTLLSQLFPQSNEDVTYEYAVGELAFTFKGICTLAAFAWPILLVLAGRKLMESRFSWILNLLEVLLCAGSLYWFFVLTLFGDWLYGAYVFVISFGLFACSSMVFLFHSLWRVCRKWRDKIRGSGAPRQSFPDPAPSG